ncbi:CDP-diacylglycerol--serine O-phosphatidyltransferase [Aquirhabdus parva]|uniref:CDP-diacylglycerol--serine O-phosphatidyltransferase n=1 Tax=Aquirhabdus parva TaxID=2283318 RepID=A0A345P6Z5_9GAMM|nr:CDP-diacylglycerol--serine O-phosphatidyltransferase [Aquirhabdus parva]
MESAVAIPEKQPERRSAEQPDLLSVDNLAYEDDLHDGLTFEIIEEERTREGSKVRSKGIYLFPNLITTAALLCGFYSVIASTSGQFEKAIYAIFLAALFDGLDGRVARWVNAQSAFGEQYDSLSDMLSFGVAPAILVYSWALQPLGRVGLACAFIYTACAAFRLARFNVQIAVVDKRYFIGLASPLAALVVASGIWVGIDNPAWIDISIIGWKILFAALVVFAGLLMISNVRYFSFKEMDRKRVPFAIMLPVVLLLIGIAYNIPLGLFCVGLIYASSGIIALIMSRTKKTSVQKESVNDAI